MSYVTLTTPIWGGLVCHSKAYNFRPTCYGLAYVVDLKNLALSVRNI